MASPSTVLTLGFGSFGSINLLPTVGFGIGATISVPTDVSRYMLVFENCQIIKGITISNDILKGVSHSGDIIKGIVSD